MYLGNLALRSWAREVSEVVAVRQSKTFKSVSYNGWSARFKKPVPIQKASFPPFLAGSYRAPNIESVSWMGPLPSHTKTMQCVHASSSLFILLWVAQHLIFTICSSGLYRRPRNNVKSWKIQYSLCKGWSVDRQAAKTGKQRVPRVADSSPKYQAHACLHTCVRVCMCVCQGLSRTVLAVQLSQGEEQQKQGGEDRLWVLAAVEEHKPLCLHACSFLSSFSFHPGFLSFPS